MNTPIGRIRENHIEGPKDLMLPVEIMGVAHTVREIGNMPIIKEINLHEIN